MIKEDKIELYKKAIATYGKEAQIGMAFEEMGELIVALNHYKRDRSDIQSIKEEIADVQIMMEQLALIFGSVNDIKEEKLIRLKTRLNGAD